MTWGSSHPCTSHRVDLNADGLSRQAWEKEPVVSPASLWQDHTGPQKDARKCDQTSASGCWRSFPGKRVSAWRRGSIWMREFFKGGEDVRVSSQQRTELTTITQHTHDYDITMISAIPCITSCCLL